MDIIRIQGLSHTYRQRMSSHAVQALRDVSFEVNRGEIFALLGPNGAGKTTLVKSLLGIVHPSAGDVTINGFTPDDPRSRLSVGYLGEHHRFPQYFTGLGLLEFAGALHGLDPDETQDRAQVLLPMVGMEKWAETRLSKYSKGMSQRIGLAQALISDPEIIILDEPTDGVDPVGRHEIRAVMGRLREAGKTILLNSHLLSEVETIADRAAILVKGELLRVASVSELTVRPNQYKIEAEFGDTFIDIDSEIGRRISISATVLMVELVSEEKINDLIDKLRIMKIPIRSVAPMKGSLEQSFMDAIRQAEAQKAHMSPAGVE
jgi:ABC-2 type transport system ATP-binding protein